MESLQITFKKTSLEYTEDNYDVFRTHTEIKAINFRQLQQSIEITKKSDGKKNLLTYK